MSDLPDKPAKVGIPGAPSEPSATDVKAEPPERDLFAVIADLNGKGHMTAKLISGSPTVLCDTSAASSLRAYGVDVHKMGRVSKQIFGAQTDGYDHLVSQTALKKEFAKRDMTFSVDASIFQTTGRGESMIGF